MHTVNLEKARLLIERGADVNARDNAGNTPLMHGLGNFETAKLLLESGADADARDSFGRTPIMLATDAETVGLLLENGADANVRTEQ